MIMEQKYLTLFIEYQPCQSQLIDISFTSQKYILWSQVLMNHTSSIWRVPDDAVLNENTS